MASRLAPTAGPHTAGIFADMTVDGPEIGTLVVIFDRARNLPNKKSMGKQNPYCAARLGKEAKKTETDQRGGQTPRWDQEIRFTVHDSPDYHNLKISVFSEDKRTDLIGEAWVGLDEVIVPGGGKKDLWQGLNCKGKYAGELRMEMTYYDSRPKPEGVKETVAVQEALRQSTSSSRVKRRPLPANPVAGAVTPDSIPPVALPGRAKHGPRDYQTPPRNNTVPSDPRPLHTQPPSHHHVAPDATASGISAEYGYPGAQAQYAEYDTQASPQLYEEPYQTPDFLPQLPASNRQWTQMQPNYAHQQQPPPPPPPSHPYVTSRRPSQVPRHPAMTSPMPSNYPEAFVEDARGSYAGSYAGDHGHGDHVDPRWSQEDRQFHDHSMNGAGAPAPPPPPMHSNSAPAVPMTSSPYSVNHPTPPMRHYSTPPSAPHSGHGPQYADHHYTPSRSYPTHPVYGEEAYPSPEADPYTTPPNPIQHYTPSPNAQIPTRSWPQRHSMGDMHAGVTSPRSHPLSQEVSRARSPQPFAQMEHRNRDGAPLVKPRPISPVPPQPDSRRPKSTYSIQHPVRAFESSDGNPLSKAAPPPSRKSVSPRPSMSEVSGNSGVPFGPDSFEVHNPNARGPVLSNHASPHSPYQIRPGENEREERNGPIVGWHGQEIDPSDHLPVDSWAPEPVKKTPTKTYGLGRERDFGPRSAVSTQGHISKDTIVNFRSKGSHDPQSTPSPPVTGRNFLVKKTHSNPSPLQEHDNYNPTPATHANPNYYGGYGAQQFSTSPGGYGAPALPPKVPMEHYDHASDALARDIASIDIGSSRVRRGGAPSPTAYTPVRSHRERNSAFY